MYVGFSRHNIPRCSAYMISEKAIRFRHPDYNPDRAQKLISSPMSRHLSTRNISSKCMHVFFCNLANRQTRAKTFISVVGGKLGGRYHQSVVAPCGERLRGKGRRDVYLQVKQSVWSVPAERLRGFTTIGAFAYSGDTKSVQHAAAEAIGWFGAAHVLSVTLR